MKKFKNFIKTVLERKRHCVFVSLTNALYNIYMKLNYQIKKGKSLIFLLEKKVSIDQYNSLKRILLPTSETHIFSMAVPQEYALKKTLPDTPKYSAIFEELSTVFKRIIH